MRDGSADTVYSYHVSISFEPAHTPGHMITIPDAEIKQEGRCFRVSFGLRHSLDIAAGLTNACRDVGQHARCVAGDNANCHRKHSLCDRCPGDIHTTVRVLAELSLVAASNAVYDQASVA